jgi:hypothetical protein
MGKNFRCGHPMERSSILTLWGMSDNLSLWDDPDRDLDIVGAIPDQYASRKTNEYTLMPNFASGGRNGHTGDGFFRFFMRN